MEDYSMYAETADVAALGGLLALAGTLWLVILAIGIFLIICYWKIFKKAGQEGWKSIIPIYNMVILFKIVGLNPLLLLVYLAAVIPVVGSLAAIAISIIAMVKLAKAFGKGGGFAAGLILLSIVFFPMLAFGDAQYVGDGSYKAKPVVEPTSENPIDENK